MILPFSTELNKRQTYFVEKILKGTTPTINYQMASDFNGKYDFNRQAFTFSRPKIHTIREDKKQRWQPGNLIHAVINNRTKNMLQFTPVMKCKSTQHIIITCTKKVWSVYIDGNIYACHQKELADKPQTRCIALLTQLAHNDGFETMEDFFSYFQKGFSGKIIHWTDLKY